MRARLRGVLLVLLLGACGPSDEVLPVTVRVGGSDAMLDLSRAWAERYGAYDRDIRFVVTGGGSSRGVAGMINRTLEVAAVRGEMAPAEIEAARHGGADPIPHRVGHDPASDRPLVLYTPGEPDDAVAAYLEWLMGDEAQCVLVAFGFTPLTQLRCG